MGGIGFFFLAKRGWDGAINRKKMGGKAGSAYPIMNPQLAQDEVNLLSHGLKFCHTPIHIDWPEFKADISDFIRILQQHENCHNNDNNSSYDSPNPPSMLNQRGHPAAPARATGFLRFLRRHRPTARQSRAN